MGKQNCLIKRGDSGCNAIYVHYFKQGKGIGHITSAWKPNPISAIAQENSFSSQCCVWWEEEEERKLPLGFIEMLVLPVAKLKGDRHALFYFLTWDFNSSVSHPDFICELLLLHIPGVLRA